jgi:SAM-dependent methyltransferase
MHGFAYSIVADYARPTDRLLEIGFGEGYGSEILEVVTQEYVGVEVEREAVTHAAAKYGRRGASFVHYDGTSLPFEDASFDLVIAFQVLEHVPDPDSFLREARRVAKAGAYVLVVTPNRNHRLADGERPWNRYHVREFSPAELEEVVGRVFHSVEIFGIQGSRAMNEIEKRRVAAARRLARLDPFGVRFVLPEGLDTRLRTLLRRLRSRPVQSPSEPLEIGIEHVYRSRDEVESSLDLLAVARAS